MNKTKCLIGMRAMLDSDASPTDYRVQLNVTFSSHESLYLMSIKDPDFLNEMAMWVEDRTNFSCVEIHEMSILH